MKEIKLNLPQLVNKDDKVILFDAVCVLCTGWARFILKFDRECIFKVASVQSKEGQAILKHLGMPTTTFDTMLYIEGDKVYKKSTAVLNIARLLPYPFRILSVFRIVPIYLRDWIYARIALNRYFIFGKRAQCTVHGAG